MLFFFTRNLGRNGGGADVCPLDPPQIFTFNASLTRSVLAMVVSRRSDFIFFMGRLGVLDSSFTTLADLAAKAALGAAFSFSFPLLLAIFFLLPLSFCNLEVGYLCTACRVRRPTGVASVA